MYWRADVFTSIPSSGVACQRVSDRARASENAAPPPPRPTRATRYTPLTIFTSLPPLSDGIICAQRRWDEYNKEAPDFASDASPSPRRDVLFTIVVCLFTTVRCAAQSRGGDCPGLMRCAQVAMLLMIGSVGALSIQMSRRHVLVAISASGFLSGESAFAADADLVRQLETAKMTLAALPKMVGDQQWDPVRNELRTPAVNALWNTMDSANTLRKLAKSRGDPEIFEAAEEVSRALRDVDGMVYSNGFSMEGKMAGAGLRGDGSGVGGKAQGEGGGKYRIKEPQALLRAAVASIDDVLALE